MSKMIPDKVGIAEVNNRGKYMGELTIHYALRLGGRYKCSVCGAKGVKLWREYQTIAPSLLCANCAGRDQLIDISHMNSDGTIVSEVGNTDCIGWLVPAVPAPGNTFWGYSSVPESGVKWWRERPNKLD